MGLPESKSKHYIQIDDLIALTETEFKNLKATGGDVTAWMDLIRTCRQPQIMWKIDYIEPLEQMSKIVNFIRRSEELIYQSRDSLDLKNGYTADINQQAAFNTIRVHLNSEEGDIETALKLMKDMLEQQYDDLSLIRQSNLLFHASLVFLCCKNLELSYHCMERHWALLKYANLTDRVQLGIWDNQCLLEMACWFFVKYSEDFRDFYSIKTKVSINDIWNHKKIALLYFLEYDTSWIASFCGLPFYNHARTLYPNLPPYEHKRSTPYNIAKVWSNSSEYAFDDNIEAVGMERYYFEQFNHQMNLDSQLTDVDKISDYLYSYYHYQTNYAENISRKSQLVDFLKTNISLDDFSSVLEPGTGVNFLPKIGNKEYFGVNISSKVCSILSDKGIPHHQGCCSLFLQETDKTFDLCFAHDILNHLTSSRLKMFMENCSKKCKYIVAAINTEDNIRHDIVSEKLSIKNINLHQTNMTMEGWKNYITPYFDCVLQQEGSWIRIFGKQKMT